MKRSLNLTMFLLAMGIVTGEALPREAAVEAMLVPPGGKVLMKSGDPLMDRLWGVADRQLKRRGREVSDRVPLRNGGVLSGMAGDFRDLERNELAVDELEMLPVNLVVRPDGGSLIRHMAPAPDESAALDDGVVISSGLTGSGMAVMREPSPEEVNQREELDFPDDSGREVPLRRDPGRDVPMPGVPVVPARLVAAGMVLGRE